MVFLIVIGMSSYALRELLNADGDSKTIFIQSGIIFLNVTVIVVSYLFSVKKYSVTVDELIIHRAIKNRVIKIIDITEIKTVDADDLSGTIRTFGNGGLFGYYGKYYNSKFGNMIWYVTQRRNRILIETNQGKKIIISPDDIGMVEKVKAQRH